MGISTLYMMLGSVVVLGSILVCSIYYMSKSKIL